MNPVINYLHILSIAIWVGGISIFSFIVAPAIFTNLTKEQSGKVVGVIFPNFYLLGVICLVIAILTSLFMGIRTSSMEQIKVGILGLMLALTLYSYLGILPKTRKIKSELQIVQNQEEKAKLKKEFSTVHRLSVILLMIILVSGLVVLFFVSRNIKLIV